MAEIDEPAEKNPPVPIRVTDRRPRFDDDADAQQPSIEPAPRYPSFVAELKEKALSAEAKLAEALNLLRQREADSDDFRARLRREMERRSHAELESWLKEMLDVLDSLDRGIGTATENGPTALREGLSKVRDQFLSTLARRGVQPMSLVGTTYDPHMAEAVALSPTSSPAEDSKILEEFRRGYTLGGQVLRPAQVRVARISSPGVSEPVGEMAPPVEG